MASDNPLTSRIIDRRTGLPGARAAVGGLLIAVAVVGVFVAYSAADSGPADRLVVAARDVREGAVIEARDVRVVPADIPPSARARTFASAADVIGHIALGPIADGEIVQASGITTDRTVVGTREVAITLPRKQIAIGRLKQGERVDVYVTSDERTTSVVRGARVVQIGSDGDRSLTSEREITIVVTVPTDGAVAALVHALRTGDVTVVRSTLSDDDNALPVVFQPNAAASTESTNR